MAVVWSTVFVLLQNTVRQSIANFAISGRSESGNFRTFEGNEPTSDQSVGALFFPAEQAFKVLQKAARIKSLAD